MDVGLDNMSKTVDVETLRDIRRMCEIVLNNTFGNSELDSLALYVGHHPLLLNSDTAQKVNKQMNNKMTEEDLQNRIEQVAYDGAITGCNQPVIEREASKLAREIVKLFTI